MITETILLKFFIILSILFFLPKAVKHFFDIPFPVTEVLLGIIVGIVFPAFFVMDDMLRILSTIGIITLFVYSGMDVDLGFVSRNRSFFLLNILIHLFVVAVVAVSIYYAFTLSLQVAFLVSLALTTPSASYILSAHAHEDKGKKAWIVSKAITGEIIALLLVVILLRINNFSALVLTLASLAALLYILPKALRFLYKRLFSKIIGTEFSFIFVVAIISAFFTELLGVHFLIGAFIAGVVSRRFIADIVSDARYERVSLEKGEQLVSGFGFFAVVFAPFYFFTVGLRIRPEMFSAGIILATALIGVAVTMLRLGAMSLHRMASVGEGPKTALHISAAVLPTLVFTFVIADILERQFGIGEFLFSTLMLYGVFTALATIILLKLSGERGKKLLVRTGKS